MFNTLWNDEELSRVELDSYVARKINEYRAFHDEKKVVGIGVRMPGVLAFDFRDHDVVTVKFRDRARCPVFTELSQLAS
ncbi:hypothetical protein AWB82_07076 [Caballeronia glebae]|uniref:Uncharacterized protein n=1 Tax=Caballeronia glebae TaxID=1777143 RepID=A0A158DRP6_9BURK|nr:hypothetical protein AWB82_07076 [Caballeronia glebae]